MKDNAINKIREQIRHYQERLKRNSWESDEPLRSELKGIIFGLEQAIISVQNS